MKKFAIAAIALFAISGAALAEPITYVENGLAVHYGDLDLSTVDGQDALAARVEQAVRRECRSPNVRSVGERQTCIVNTRAQALAGANDEARTALLAAAARKGGPAPATTLAAR